MYRNQNRRVDVLNYIVVSPFSHNYDNVWWRQDVFYSFVLHPRLMLNKIPNQSHLEYLNIDMLGFPYTHFAHNDEEHHSYLIQLLLHRDLAPSKFPIENSAVYEYIYISDSLCSHIGHNDELP